MRAIGVVSQRSFLRVQGRDARKFLNGLTTNNTLNPGNSVLFSAFLSPQGRVLYDALIYDITSSSSSAATPSFLIECDSRALQQAAPPHASTSTNGAISPSSLTSGRPLPAAGLMRHLKKYILSNNVLVENVSHEYSVYRIWPESPVNGGSGTVAAAADSELSIDKVSNELKHIMNSQINFNLVRDPRCCAMGLRLLLSNASAEGVNALWSLPAIRLTSETEERIQRILLGIPQGMEELPHGACLPLESNIDYMNGVDFRKGCYLGQELTIRTFHTGITRKRILPIQLFETEAEALSSFNANNNSTPLLDISTNLKLPAHLSDIRPVNLASSTPIGRPIGKFYSGIHNIGLALLRLDAAVPTTTQSNSNASSSDQHKIVAQVDGGLWLRAFRPTQWWPQNINTESTHLTL